MTNVSVNTVDLLIQKKRYRGIRIGTVMTHPDYRRKGLAANLLNEVVAAYKGAYDFMYLFVNKTALSFYPKFGFKEEYSFSMNFAGRGAKKHTARKLDVTNKEDYCLFLNMLPGDF